MYDYTIKGITDKCCFTKCRKIKYNDYPQLLDIIIPYSLDYAESQAINILLTIYNLDPNVDLANITKIRTILEANDLSKSKYGLSYLQTFYDTIKNCCATYSLLYGLFNMINYDIDDGVVFDYLYNVDIIEIMKLILFYQHKFSIEYKSTIDNFLIMNIQGTEKTKKYIQLSQNFTRDPRLKGLNIKTNLIT